MSLLPLCPAGLAYQDPGNPQSPAQTPLQPEQQGRQGARPPGPPAQFLWAWGSRRAPASLHRIEAERHLLGTSVCCVLMGGCDQAEGQELCRREGAPRALPRLGRQAGAVGRQRGAAMPSLPRVYSWLPAAVIPCSEAAPPPQQQHRPGRSPVTVTRETANSVVPVFLFPYSQPPRACRGPILLSGIRPGCAASGPACSPPGGGRGEGQDTKVRFSGF